MTVGFAKFSPTAALPAKAKQLIAVGGGDLGRRQDATGGAYAHTAVSLTAMDEAQSGRASEE